MDSKSQNSKQSERSSKMVVEFAKFLIKFGRIWSITSHSTKFDIQIRYMKFEQISPSLTHSDN